MRIKAYRGSLPFIFVSYSHKDTDAALRIIEKLQQDGFRVWFDEGITPAEIWDDDVADHIIDCDFMIVLVSKNYIESENCVDELSYAKDKKKNYLLVYMDDAEFARGMEMRFGRRQKIFMNQYPDKAIFYQKLYTAKGIESCRDREVSQKKPEIEYRIKQEEKAEIEYQIKQEKKSEIKKQTQQVETKTSKTVNLTQDIMDRAEHNDPWAQLTVGNAYYYGTDLTPVDWKKAVLWYERAARNGYAVGHYNVALMYKDGKGCEKDEKKAFEHFLRASQGGYSKAYKWTGYLYYKGLGTEKKLSEAFYWFEKSDQAENDAYSVYMLGLMYQKGEHVAKNHRLALEYYKKAADMDYTSAYYAVGFMYERGYGADRNLNIAIDYYTKGANKGDANSSKALARLKH